MKIGPIEIGENIPDMVTAVGTVLKALDRPVIDSTKTVTKTSKKTGKVTTRVTRTTVTGAELGAILFVYWLWKSGYGPGKLPEKLKEAWEGYTGEMKQAFTPAQLPATAAAFVFPPSMLLPEEQASALGTAIFPISAVPEAAQEAWEWIQSHKLW